VEAPEMNDLETSPLGVCVIVMAVAWFLWKAGMVLSAAFKDEDA
jgi:hypothetical protein